MIKWILLVWAIVSLFVGCNHMMSKAFPHIEKSEAYTLETNWGPVVTSVGPCWSTGGRSAETICWVKRDGMEYEKMSLNLLPGNMVQMGEKLGVAYKISDKVVESYTVRDAWSKTWYPRSSCWKTDAKCYWPSKGQ